MKQTSLLLVIVVAVLAAACSQAAESRAPVVDGALSAVEPTPTMQPTPTLLPGLTQPPPTPPITPPPALTATPLPTPAPSVTPSPTPALADRLSAGLHRLELGDFAAAAEHLAAVVANPSAFSAVELMQAQLGLGRAYLSDGRFTAAADTLTQLLALPNPPAAARHLLGQALEGAGDNTGALAAYQRYLADNPDMAAYVNLDIARLSASPVDALNAFEAALGGHAQRLHKVAIHQQLAEFYVAQGNTAAAIEQYLAIRDLAITEATKGQMTYLAGMAYLQMGNAEAAYQQFALGVDAYPRAYESYLGLVQLVEAGIPVDEFQRGLVDYYAGAYEPGIEAFQRYITQNPEAYRADTHLFLAYTYEALGNVAAALAQLDAYAAREPADALIERAGLLTRTGDRAGALAAYQAYLASFPAGADAPTAAWWTAVFHERNGDIPAAIAAYSDMAANYPAADDAPEALFRAGWLANNAGDWETAVSLWWRTAQSYPSAEYGSAAIVWLLRTLPTHTTPTVAETAVAATPIITPTATVITTTPVLDIDTIRTEVAAIAQNVGPRTDYYGLRAYHVVTSPQPFPPIGPFPLPDAAATAALQAEAETWLAAQLALEPGTNVAGPSPLLLDSPAFIVGSKLWEIGRLEQAKAELESLRRDTSSQALLSYQLALYFREIGLYRSSIIAASSTLSALRVSIFEAPRFLGQLAYPVYYGDMITALADQYGYDSRLQFSLVRQESLFESFARSGAAAQGLSQVIPDTGVYIANLLNWPDYENDDLYKPYVGLQFGAFYLAQQLRGFDGFVSAALAAYNAGPGNAAYWYDITGPDHDLFVETVAFAETRLYVERIYLGYYLYTYLYGD